MFTADAEILSPLQRRFETYRNERAQYEQQLESPLIDADELDDGELEMPEFMDDIATTDSQPALLESGEEEKNEQSFEDEKSDSQ
ncbi:hypothetical protein [Halospeciosus flavus]